MTTNSSRREFLKQLTLVLAGLGASSFSEAEGRGSYKLGPWTGDDFTVGHKLRDGKLPKLPTAPEAKVDFVIVGGGIAGLGCAHYLADSDFILLEQYDTLGGHARGGSHNGIGYSYGSAYLAILDGAVGELINDLGLQPAKLETAKEAWYHNQKWLTGSEADQAYQGFKKLETDFKDFWGKWDGLYPSLTAYPDLLKMDDKSLESYLTGYDEGFIRLIDNFVRSAVGGGVSSVSGLAGISAIEDIFLPTYVLPGGNPAITSSLNSKLSQSHGDRLKKGAFVWDIKMKDDGASVTYGLSDGSMHMVDCRHVIVAIPHMVSVRIAKNIGDKVKSTMFRFRYNSYLVANILLKDRVFKGCYDNFLPAPFEISDIITAETPYIFNKSYKDEMGSVLTVYIPYEAASPGRTTLYQGNKKKMAKTVTDQLQKLIPQLDGNIEEVILSRWGHAFAVPRPQFFKYVGELQALQGDSFSLAHSSAHGLPCAEAAVQGAKVSANRAKAKKTAAKPIYSLPSLKTTAIVSFAIAALSLLTIIQSARPALAVDTKSGAPTRQATNPTFWPPILNNYYPDMVLLDQDGKKVQLSSFKGKIIIIEPIGMSYPACQAFAGANKPGARSYSNVRPQGGLKSFEEYLQEYTGKNLSDSRIVFAQLLLYNMNMKAPTLEEAQVWARTFGMNSRNNRYVLIGQNNMLGGASYNMIPGFQLIDQSFVLRSDSTGHNPKNDLYTHFFPMAKRLLGG